MTNGWVDIKNADMMLVMGGNPAENHPCGFKWVIEAKRNRNAKLIVVDPRYTRTAAVSDLFLQIRAGADIAFLGGFIRYAIENNRINRDYLLNFTNAAFIVKDDFKLPEDDGVFSGFDAKTQTYDKSTWNYAGPGVSPPSLPQTVHFDLTLQNPRCVYQLLRKHYSRYTPEMVERITGIPKDQYLKAADLFTSIRKDGDTRKVATVIYAVGWTQHSFGTQIIRTAAILQLMMGNVGRAGGGVNALRGHSNIQGATDMAGIFDNLPGYLKVPTPADGSLAGWMKRITPTPSKPSDWQSFNYWSNTPKFAVSLLKGFYGDAATKQNDFAYDFLPKVDRNYSWTYLWDNMYNGVVKGLFAFGMNGVAIGPDTKKNIDALKRADWLVVGEIYPDETSEFWRSPGITHRRNEVHPNYCLPPAVRWVRREGRQLHQFGAVAAMEKRGSPYAARLPLGPSHRGANFPESARASINPKAANSRIQFEIDLELHRPIESFACRSTEGNQWQDLCGREDPATKQQLKTGQQLPGFAWLKDDGTTACGNWIYSGAYTEAGNLTMRVATQAIPPAWGYTRIGHGPGRPIAACFTTALPALPKVSLGILRAGRCGGVSPHKSGLAMMCRISKPIRSPLITWARSS